MHTTILALAMGIFLAAAYGDVRERRIPNAFTYCLGALGVIQLILGGDPIAAGWTVMAGAAVLVVGILLFSGGVFGGGEAKLLTGVVLLIGFRDLLGFLLLTSLCGTIAMLALMMEFDVRGWLRRVVRPAAMCLATDGAAAAEVRPTVPYGIVIAWGGVMMLLMQTLTPR